MNKNEEKVSALERFRTAMRHKQEVKQQIIEKFAAEGRQVDVVFL